MSELKMTEDHEWLRIEDDGSVTIGITDHAQKQLGDVVYVELHNTGDTFAAGSEAAVVESVKAAGEIKAPIGGEIVAVNDGLADEPELVNSDPDGNGWFFKMTPDDVSELDHLMDEDAYQEFIKDL